MPIGNFYLMPQYVRPAFQYRPRIDDKHINRWQRQQQKAALSKTKKKIPSGVQLRLFGEHGALPEVDLETKCAEPVYEQCPGQGSLLDYLKIVEKENRRNAHLKKAEKAKHSLENDPAYIAWKEARKPNLKAKEQKEFNLRIKEWYGIFLRFISGYIIPLSHPSTADCDEKEERRFVLSKFREISMNSEIIHSERWKKEKRELTGILREIYRSSTIPDRCVGRDMDPEKVFESYILKKFYEELPIEVVLKRAGFIQREKNSDGTMKIRVRYY